ncbi:MAG TPA: hypothetical protein PKC68_04730 [Alphaproteobacteria bacterium]|jgi:hypothetical protein|nr:hypothetical protein [Alphaproteobacteria bacterium]
MDELILPYNPNAFKKWVENFHSVDEFQAFRKQINKKVYVRTSLQPTPNKLEKLFSEHSSKIPYSKEFELELKPLIETGFYLQKIMPQAKIELRLLLGKQPNYDGEIKIDGKIIKTQITCFFNESTKGLIRHLKQHGYAKGFSEYKGDGSISKEAETALSECELIKEFYRELKSLLIKKTQPKFSYQNPTWLIIYIPFYHKLCNSIVNKFEQNMRLIGLKNPGSPIEYEIIETRLYPKKILEVLWDKYSKEILQRLFLVIELTNPTNNTQVYFDSLFS